MKENIAKIIKNNLCTNCAFCVAICPENAIEIRFTKKGYVLRINDNCVECGLCNAVCPGKEIINYKAQGRETKQNYYFGTYQHIYSIFSNDFNNRYNGSSGGTVSEILIYLLDKKIVSGAIVTAFDKNNPLKPRVFIAKSKNEVLSAQGSKYSPVPLGEAFKAVQKDKRYAVVGIPCHLQALAKYIKIKGFENEHFLKLGLFCSRTNELNATRKLLKLNRVKEKNVTRIKYRGNGHPGKFQIDLKNGDRKYINHLDRTYWSNLFKNYYMPYRCWLCADKTAVCADVSFGDDWARSFFADKVGHSLAIARTDSGVKIIKDMAAENLINGRVVTEGYVINAQGLPYKMNIKDRLKIVDFFGKAKPDYKGYDFREENQSFNNEIMMFLRICLIKSFLLNPIIDVTFFVSKITTYWKTIKQCMTVIPESVALILLKRR